jgi:hypothetical protein
MKPVVLLLAAIAASSQAQTVGVHLVSHHMPQHFYTNANPGLYYRDASGWTVGAFRNSERKVSVYGGYTFYTDFHGWQPALTVGVIHGYRSRGCYHSNEGKCETLTLPFVFPSIATPDVDGWRLRLGYKPKARDKASHVLHLMVEKEL